MAGIVIVLLGLVVVVLRYVIEVERENAAEMKRERYLKGYYG